MLLIFILEKMFLKCKYSLLKFIFEKNVFKILKITNIYSLETNARQLLVSIPIPNLHNIQVYKTCKGINYKEKNCK